MNTQPKKRWRQFSLRGLLILTFGAACFCAGWLERQRELNREKELLEAEIEAEMRRAMQQLPAPLPASAAPAASVRDDLFAP